MGASLCDIGLGPILGAVALKLVKRSEPRICVGLNWVFVVLVAKQSLDNSRCVLTQVVCVVATFLHGDDLWANLDQLSRHIEVHEGTQLGPAELVVDRAVEAARDQDQVWLELAGDGEKKFVAGVFVLIAPKVSHFIRI